MIWLSCEKVIHGLYPLWHPKWVPFFVGGNMTGDILYCPNILHSGQCKNELCKKKPYNFDIGCRKCGYVIGYIAKKDKAVAKYKIPERVQSGGMRFY